MTPCWAVLEGIANAAPLAVQKVLLIKCRYQEGLFDYAKTASCSPYRQHCHLPPCSPFGIYLLHTDGGSLVCDDADEAAQMLFLTLQRLSNAIDARPWYVVSEHMMPRYETAVAAYLADTETEPKQWGALTYEARSMYELGVVMALNEQSAELKEILRCGLAEYMTVRLVSTCMFILQPAMSINQAGPNGCIGVSRLWQLSRSPQKYNQEC